MATDTATSQSYGVVNMAIGSFTGAGEAVDVTLGFVPRRIELINLTDRIVQIWTADMAATHCLNIAANGDATDDTGTLVSPKGDGATDTYRGFLIAAGAAVNAKVYHWTAFG